MNEFKGRRNDTTWGKYDYPVTQTQKAALEGLWFMTRGLPRAVDNPDLPKGCFYSQHPITGAVIFGLFHRSVSVLRNGRVVANT